MSWLYVPGSVDSNSASNSQIQQPDAFVMSRGKPMQPQSLSNAWKKKPWMKHLSGLTLDHSTASRGVAKWIASLGDTRASPFPLQEPVKEKTTPDTSGLLSNGSSAKSSPKFASSRMSLGMYRWDLKQSSTTFKEWATRLRRACSQRKKSVQPMKETDYSLWATPRVASAMCRMSLRPLVSIKKHFQGRNRFRTGNLEDDVAILHCSLQNLENLVIGDVSRRTLNPQFLEWMMGIPIGWTECDAMEMEWSHWQRVMRGEFSKIVSRWNQYQYNEG